MDAIEINGVIPEINLALPPAIEHIVMKVVNKAQKSVKYLKGYFTFQKNGVPGTSDFSVHVC